MSEENSSSSGEKSAHHLKGSLRQRDLMPRSAKFLCLVINFFGRSLMMIVVNPGSSVKNGMVYGNGVDRLVMASNCSPARPDDRPYRALRQKLMKPDGRRKPFSEESH